jgi:hypothetical protein
MDPSELINDLIAKEKLIQELKQQIESCDGNQLGGESSSIKHKIELVENERDQLEE